MASAKAGALETEGATISSPANMIPPSRANTEATVRRRRVRRRRRRRLGGLPGGPLAGTVQSGFPRSWAGAPQCGQLGEDTPAGALSRDGPDVLTAPSDQARLTSRL